MDHLRRTAATQVDWALVQERFESYETTSGLRGEVAGSEWASVSYFPSS